MRWNRVVRRWRKSGPGARYAAMGRRLVKSMVHALLRLTVLTLVAGALTPPPAVSQESAATEREAFAAVRRIGEAVDRAPDGNALLHAAEQAIAAGGRAAGAFTAADRARDAALLAYRAAYRAALAGAVTCGNGYPCTNNRVDPFDGFAAAFAAHFELIAAVSAANAFYVDAVGIPGGDAARARSARIRGLAARMRDLGAVDDPVRWNALVGNVGAEIDADNLLHRRANAARHAADLALVDEVTRVMDALYAAANRIPQTDRHAAAVDGETDPAARMRRAAGDGSSAALRAALDNAQGAMESLRSRIVAAAASVPDLVLGAAETVAASPDVSGGAAETTAAPVPDVAPTPAAETGVPGGDDALRAGTADAEPEPANDVAPRAGTADAEAEPLDDAPAHADTAAAELEPLDDVARWAGALTAAARAAEQAAADAETAAGGSGSSRASSCSDAEARVAAAAARVRSLTVGDDRPRFVPARTGRETYSDLFHLLDAAQRRARAACGSSGR